MGRKSRYSGGAKYANGNYKEQQKDYNATEYGLKIRVAANKADRESKRNGTGYVGDKRDASHVKDKNGKKKVVLASESANRGGKGPHKRRKPRTNIA